MRLQQCLWQTRCFPTEHQKIFGAKHRLIVPLRPTMLHQPIPGRGRLFGGEARPIIPKMPIHLLPVIHPRSLQFAVAQPKPQRPDQVQPHTRCRTQPRHIPGVWRYLRLNKDDIHQPSPLINHLQQGQPAGRGVHAGDATIALAENLANVFLR